MEFFRHGWIARGTDRRLCGCGCTFCRFNVKPFRSKAENLLKLFPVLLVAAGDIDRHVSDVEFRSRRHGASSRDAMPAAEDALSFRRQNEIDKQFGAVRVDRASAEGDESSLGDDGIERPDPLDRGALS